MSSQGNPTYLPEGLPIPVAEPDGLSAPYWAGLHENRLMVLRCSYRGTWRFRPEWVCHHCHAFDPEWTETASHGRVFSRERVWHPSHAALSSMVRISPCVWRSRTPAACGMVGNLPGDAMQAVSIGAYVEGVFEHHPRTDAPYSLLHRQIP